MSLNVTMQQWSGDGRITNKKLNYNRHAPCRMLATGQGEIRPIKVTRSKNEKIFTILTKLTKFDEFDKIWRIWRNWGNFHDFEWVIFRGTYGTFTKFSNLNTDPWSTFLIINTSSVAITKLIKEQNVLGSSQSFPFCTNSTFAYLWTG